MALPCYKLDRINRIYPAFSGIDLVFLILYYTSISALAKELLLRLDTIGK